MVVRRDDSYAVYASELFGVPFVHVPRRLTGGHQTDLRLGADCIALVIYARRRMGQPIRYVAPSVLRRHLTKAPSPAAGDVLDFGFQTAILIEDHAPLGVVSDDDRLIHTFHGLAEEARLGDLPYANAPVEVLRWP